MTISSRILRATVSVIFLVAVQVFSAVRADDLLPAEHDLFERHVRPVLTAHCICCHGELKQEGGLNRNRSRVLHLTTTDCNSIRVKPQRWPTVFTSIPDSIQLVVGPLQWWHKFLHPVNGYSESNLS
jgi:hypothetical protein